jgi:hypothetical protein
VHLLVRFSVAATSNTLLLHTITVFVFRVHPPLSLLCRYRPRFVTSTRFFHEILAVRAAFRALLLLLVLLPVVEMVVLELEMAEEVVVVVLVVSLEMLESIWLEMRLKSFHLFRLMLSFLMFRSEL